MKNEGWIKIHRSVQEHWVYQNDKYFKWWIIVLLNVNHSPSKFPVNSELQVCNPGQSFKSIESWSSLLGCSKKTVLRFFTLLKNDHMISRKIIGKGNRRKHLLTVQNWKKYQDKSPKMTPETPSIGNPKLPPNKNEEELKNEFNIARKLFPGTKRGLDTEFENLKKKHSLWYELIPLFEPAIIKQIQYRKNPPPDKFIPDWQNFQTWINQKSWELEFTFHDQGYSGIDLGKSIYADD